MSDIASELTNSADRGGRGGMSAPFKLVDGLVSGPGLAFNSEPNSGLYRAGANDIRLTVAGADAFGFSNIASVGKLTPYFPLDLTAQTVSPSAGTVYDENPIINGAMVINQRAPAGTASAPNGAWIVDRMRYLKTGTMVHTTSQGPGGATAQFQTDARVQLTTPQATLAAGDLCLFQYRIEGYDFVGLAQRQITLSFWAVATLGGVYSCALVNGGADRCCVMTFTLASNAWTYVKLTFPASPSAGTWNYTNGIGLIIDFTIASGSSGQTSTLGTWQTGAFYAASTQVNGVATGATVFAITGLRIDPGPVAAPFRYRTFADELARCRRYYNKTFPYATAPAQTAGTTGVVGYTVTNAGTAGGRQLEWQYPVPMRVAPTTVTYYNPSAANANWRNVSGSVDSAAASSFFVSDRSLILSNPQVAGDAVPNFLALHISADAEL